MAKRWVLGTGIATAIAAIGLLLGAALFAPGLGVAQTGDEGSEDGGGTDGGMSVTIDGWCFGDGEGPFAVAAEAIGTPHGDLLYAMRDGSSIAEVAESEGVDPQVVIDALVAAWQERLDGAVDDGFFSREVADEIAAGFEERATNLVNGDLPSFPRLGGGFPGGPPWHRSPLLPGDGEVDAETAADLF